MSHDTGPLLFTDILEELMSHTCSHIFDTGGLCRSFAVTGQRYCVHHLRYRARRLSAAQARACGERFQFDLPPLESMYAVHSALSQLADAIAHGAIDTRSALALLSVLRIASSNLRHPESWQPSLYESTAPAPEIDVAAEYGLPADTNFDNPIESVILSEGGAPFAPPQSKDPFYCA